MFQPNLRCIWAKKYGIYGTAWIVGRRNAIQAFPGIFDYNRKTVSTIKVTKNWEKNWEKNIEKKIEKNDNFPPLTNKNE